jgi:NodT family efflux transporter outer membrane factor (OMF) lipoprotein
MSAVDGLALLNMRRRTLFIGLPALVLSACSAGPDYAPPPLPSAPALQSGKFVRAGAVDVAGPVARWWESIADPTLTRLIDKGLRDAPGLAAAEARVRQARASLSSARGAMLPSLNAGATYIRADLPDRALGDNSGTIDLFNVGIDARWEVDLWGARRRGVESAVAGAEAASARLADVQVSLSAEIARTYVLLRAREAGLALLDQRLAAEAAMLDLARQRFTRGTVAAQAVESARMQLIGSQSERATQAADAVVLRDALAVLTGGAPGTLDDIGHGAIPLPPAQVAIGDPAAMLARRPDVRVAEKDLAGATARIGVEQAKRFPQITLLGLIGLGGTSAGDTLDSSQLLTAALPRLSWNFLDFGRTRAAVQAAEAGRDVALAEYDATVLSALQDAEASLERFGAARTAFGRSLEAEGHADRIAGLQDQRAQAGTISRAEALEAQKAAIDAGLAGTEKRAGVMLAYVALAKSLGLGWQNAR